MTSVLENAHPVPVPVPRRRPVVPDALAELTRLAALAELARTSSPSLMHHAILAGTGAATVSAAADMDIAEGHVRWHAWAETAVGLDEYLRVHTAFADALIARHEAFEEAL